MANETQTNRGEARDRNTENLTTADLAGRAHRSEEAGDRDKSWLDPRESNAPSGPRTGAPAGTSSVAATPRTTTVENEEATPLFRPEQAADFRARWDGIQVRFVDEPRLCVEQADSLVAETMKRLAESFSKQRENLEQQWHRGGEVSTEDLRLALRRYRSFFGRLMQI